MSSTGTVRPSAPLTTTGSVTKALGKPDDFYGDRGQLDRWETSVRRWLVLLKIPEDQRALVATSYLKGKAEDWAQPLVKAYLVDKDDDEDIFGSFEKLVKGLNDVFGLTTQKEVAERALLDLRQITTVSAYAATFNRYAGRTDWNDAAKMHAFRQGLKGDVLDELMRFGGKLEDLEDIIRAAINVDDQLYLRRLEKRGKGAWKDRAGPRMMGRPIRTMPAGDPMEIDMTTPAPSSKRNGKRGTRSKKSFTCYACGKEGHIAKNCHSRNKVRREEFGMTMVKNTLSKASEEGAAQEGSDSEEEDNWQIVCPTPSDSAEEEEPDSTQEEDTIERASSALLDTLERISGPLGVKTVELPSIVQNEAAIQNRWHAEHSVQLDCTDSKCEHMGHIHDKFIRQEKVTRWRFQRYLQEIPRDRKHPDHSLVDYCLIIGCDVHYYNNGQQGPLWQGKPVSYPEMFRIKNFIASWKDNPNHALTIVPSECRDPRCAIPAHWQYRYREEQAARLGATNDHPIHPEHDRLNYCFCRNPERCGAHGEFGKNTGPGVTMFHYTKWEHAAIEQTREEADQRKYLPYRYRPMEWVKDSNPQ